MGTAPCGSTEDDLDLLTTRKTSHGVVRDKLRFQTEVSKVLLDLATNEGAQETKALSFTGINLQNFLCTEKSLVRLDSEWNTEYGSPSRNHA